MGRTLQESDSNEEEHNWPNDDLANAVKKLREDFKGDDTIKPSSPHNMLSFEEHEEAKKQLEEFAPDVNIIGLGLWSERYPLATRIFGDRIKKLRPWPYEYWGGVLTRVVEKVGDSKNRCLQYLYVYTRQRGTISFSWMIVLPFLMFIWSSYLRYLFDPDNPITADETIKMLAFFAAPIPVIVMALKIHLEDYFENPEGKRLGFRSTDTFFVLYPILAFSWYSDLLTNALFIIGVGFAVAWLVEYCGVSPSSHAMDYVPVFVWIEQNPSELEDLNEEKRKKFIGSDNWMIKHIVWDKFHYYCEPRSWEHLGPYIDNKRILLEIPDTWHAMEPERVGGITGISKRLYKAIGGLVCALVFVIGILVRFEYIMWMNNFLSNLGILELTRSVIFPLLFIAGGVLVVRGRFELVKDHSEYIASNAELTDDKLHALWNLEEKPRLKVITKLQYPFEAFEFDQNEDDKKKDLQSFHDDPFFLYSPQFKKE
ncbi:MAG: hypothetical protein RTU30_11650 [Candidatus Thorarchaeota archaeon]